MVVSHDLDFARAISDQVIYFEGGRAVETDDGLKLLGFLHNPGGGAFVGEISDPAPVTAQPDGLLKLG